MKEPGPLDLMTTKEILDALVDRTDAIIVIGLDKKGELFERCEGPGIQQLGLWTIAEKARELQTDEIISGIEVAEEEEDGGEGKEAL